MPKDFTTNLVTSMCFESSNFTGDWSGTEKVGVGR